MVYFKLVLPFVATYTFKSLACVLDITFPWCVWAQDLQIWKNGAGFSKWLYFVGFFFCWFSHSFEFKKEINGNHWRFPASRVWNAFLSPWHVPGVLEEREVHDRLLGGWGWDCKGEVFEKFGHKHVWEKEIHKNIRFGLATQKACFGLVWSFRNCVPVDI